MATGGSSDGEDLAGGAGIDWIRRGGAPDPPARAHMLALANRRRSAARMQPGWRGKRWTSRCHLQQGSTFSISRN